MGDGRNGKRPCQHHKGMQGKARPGNQLSGFDDISRYAWIVGRGHMKLARYRTPSGTQCGVVIDDGVVSFSSMGLGFITLDELIAGGDEALDRIRGLVLDRRPEHRLIEIELLAPFPKPGKYLAIGMNFGKHVEALRRMGANTAGYQMWFNKQTTCI